MPLTDKYEITMIGAVIQSLALIVEETTKNR